MDRQLINYLPEVLKNIEDYKAIMQAEQVEVETLWTSFKDSLKDAFIEDATENGVLRFEKILDITPKAVDSLDDRKFRILARFSEELPYTDNTLNEKLIKLCGDDGYTCEYHYGSYTLKVRIELTRKAEFEAVKSMLNRVVPANLIIDLSLRYNQYSKLMQFTHGKLKAYTHKHIREEVMR